MGPFDELFDFNRDGKVEPIELAIGMELMEEMDSNEDGEWDEEDIC